MHVGDDEKAGIKLIEENPGWVVDSRRMKLAKETAIYSLYAVTVMWR